jgi:hypothetical protein
VKHDFHSFSETQHEKRMETPKHSEYVWCDTCSSDLRKMAAAVQDFQNLIAGINAALERQ